MRIRRMTCLLAAILLLALCVIPPDTLTAYAASSKDGMVRVHLTSLGSPSSLDVTVSGGYSVDGAVQMNLYDGQKVNFTFNSGNGQITMNVGGKSHAMGQEMALRRHQASGGSGLYIAQAKRPKCIYEGDMQLIARPTGSGYRLYVIMHVYIETYLYGVVPNEMSSSWPLEALKAQAVSARTYTLNRMNTQASALYDLNDSSSHQVYYGYAGVESRAVQAVDATKGVVLMYNGSVCSTYYTASNGGQTESAKNVWGGSRYPYLTVKDDPYDARNPSANRRNRTVYRDFNASGQNSSLKSLLTSAAGGASITSINSITPHTAKYPSPSRLYTKMDFNVTLSGGSTRTLTLSIFDQLESAMDMSITDSNNEIWTVTDNGSTFTLTAGRWGHGVGMSQRGAQQMAEEGLGYQKILSFYYDGSSLQTYNFTQSILPSIGSGATVRPSAPPLNPGEQHATVNSNAATLNMRSGPGTEYDVIAEIPRGTIIVVTTYGPTWCQVRWNSLTGYVMTNYLTLEDSTGPVDPPPVDPGEGEDPLPPVEPEIPTGETAVLQEDAELRTAASSSAASQLYIPAGETVTILNYGETWCQVSYSGLTGYVPTSCLGTTGEGGQPAVSAAPTAPSLGGGTPTPAAPTPSPTPEPTYAPVQKLGLVLLQSEMRRKPSTDSPRIGIVPANVEVYISRMGGNWAEITYEGITGWIIAGMLHITNENAATPTPTPVPTPTATPTPTPTAPPLGEPFFTSDGAQVDPRAAWVDVTSGSRKVYAEPSTDSQVLMTLEAGSDLTVLSEGSDWCQVQVRGRTGYMQRKAVAFEDPNEAIGTRYVNTQTDPLSLRDKPQTRGSKVLLYIPRAAKVRLIKDLGDWAYIEYDGKTGYSAMRYLSRAKPEEAVKAADVLLDATLQEVTGWEAVVQGKNGSAIDLLKWCATSAPFICEIEDGAKVKVLQKGNIWCQINYEGEEGFCLTSRLQLIPPAD